MLTPFGFFDLIETFPKHGCAVCNLLLRDVDRLLDSIVYEFVTDPEMQNKFRASRGLCNEHSWQLAKIGNALGVAILYEGVIDEVLKTLDQVAVGGGSQNGFARRLFQQNSNAALLAALEATQPCIACEAENAAEAEYVNVLSSYLSDERMAQAYRASDGLCFDHFKQTLGQTSDAEKAKLLIGIQREIWQRLQAELLEFMRKNDFQHAAEAMGAEGDSWLRAVGRVGGEKGVFGLRR